ncbi:uncharacterized protein LOC125767156 [Anopheles funestus]|uniref:uncharacterized protein LOC125767156 n=1 Tax=Anopheles funestus TaxID=62324 RepID=UPI0020C5CC21|nr:uncharacterized protein LOC125767156 [Anopheles funestus]
MIVSIINRASVASYTESSTASVWRYKHRLGKWMDVFGREPPVIGHQLTPFLKGKQIVYHAICQTAKRAVRYCVRHTSVAARKSSYICIVSSIPNIFSCSAGFTLGHAQQQYDFPREPKVTATSPSSSVSRSPAGRFLGVPVHLACCYTTNHPNKTLSIRSTSFQTDGDVSDCVCVRSKAVDSPRLVRSQ